MAGTTKFPAALDDNSTLYQPGSGDLVSAVDHAQLHDNASVAVIAAETKIGIGSTTPAANQLLVGIGSGTSAWQGLTSAQLAAIISDETGSGKAVFGTSPTLTTPVIASIVNTGTLTLPTSTDTLVGRATTDILTNKTLTSPIINQFNTASGLGAAWQSWTPTWTGSTIGNSAVVAKSIQIGKIVHFHMAVTLGSTFVMAVGTDTTFTLPVTSVSSGYSQYVSVIGRAASLHTGTSQFGSVAWNSTTTALLQAEKIVSSTNVATAWSTTNVGTSAGDTWGITGSYEAA